MNAKNNLLLTLYLQNISLIKPLILRVQLTVLNFPLKNTNNVSTFKVTQMAFKNYTTLPNSVRLLSLIPINLSLTTKSQKMKSL